MFCLKLIVDEMPEVPTKESEESEKLDLPDVPTKAPVASNAEITPAESATKTKGFSFGLLLLVRLARTKLKTYFVWFVSFLPQFLKNLCRLELEEIDQQDDFIILLALLFLYFSSSFLYNLEVTVKLVYLESYCVLVETRKSTFTNFSLVQ